MSDNAFIQVLQSGGSWWTVNTVMNVSQFITHSMTETQSRYPNSRVRAVDDNGRILDIM